MDAPRAERSGLILGGLAACLLGHAAGLAQDGLVPYAGAVPAVVRAVSESPTSELVVRDGVLLRAVPGGVLELEGVTTAAAELTAPRGRPSVETCLLLRPKPWACPIHSPYLPCAPQCCC